LLQLPTKSASSAGLLVAGLRAAKGTAPVLLGEGVCCALRASTRADRGRVGVLARLCVDVCCSLRAVGVASCRLDSKSAKGSHGCSWRAWGCAVGSSSSSSPWSSFASSGLLLLLLLLRYALTRHVCRGRGGVSCFCYKFRFLSHVNRREWHGTQARVKIEI